MTTVTIDGKDYSLAPLTVEAVEAISLGNKTGIQFNIALVAASLRSGGDLEVSEDAVKAMPFFAVFSKLLDAAAEVNGLRTTKPGGAQPGGPAESTSTTSTAA